MPDCISAIVLGRPSKQALKSPPRMIVSDSGTELTSNAILAWQEERQIECHPASRCRMDLCRKL